MKESVFVSTSTTERSITQPDSPGVIVFPPILFLSALVVGVTVQLIWPVHLWKAWPARVFGALLILTGINCVRWAKRRMQRLGTNPRPSQPTTAIVEDGPYRYTRNPIYLGAMVAYTGLALVCNAFWLLPALMPFFLLLHWGVVLREEKYLEGKFGNAYRTYKARVPRWI